MLKNLNTSNRRSIYPSVCLSVKFLREGDPNNKLENGKIHKKVKKNHKIFKFHKKMLKSVKFLKIVKFKKFWGLLSSGCRPSSAWKPKIISFFRV